MRRYHEMATQAAIAGREVKPFEEVFQEAPDDSEKPAEDYRDNPPQDESLAEHLNAVLAQKQEKYRQR